MKALIDIFRMNEISAQKRAMVIIKLGQCINNEYQSSITEPLVYELVSILDPDNDIFKNKHFVKIANNIK